MAEAAGLAFFVSCASIFTVLLEHPASPVRQMLAHQELGRRAIMGGLMGLVIVVIIYSPWGQRSGAHINPAVTAAFWQLGKLRRADALWYLAFQLIGALAAAQLMKHVLLRPWYPHPAVNYVLTLPPPGPHGWWLAWLAEFGIVFVLMGTTLLMLHSASLKRWTGWVTGVLIAAYIIFETPYSGMSLNPARSLASAVAAGQLHGYWIYLTAPLAGAWLATTLFRRFYHGQPLTCAILAGCEAAPNSPHRHEDATEPPVYPDSQATEKD
ncbi:aquaporin [Hymenobacter coalescens]